MPDRRAVADRLLSPVMLGLLALLAIAPSGACAKSGFASAGAEQVWVGAAQLAELSGAPANESVRLGFWLDLDGGQRREAYGSSWGLGIGWVGAAASASAAVARASLGLDGRYGVASSVYAWNAWWPGELLLTSDLWLGYDKATWYTSGFRAAPRIGARLLLGYGGAIRARLRVDVAPTLLVAKADGREVALYAIWVRAGIDVGLFTVAGWMRVVAGRRANASGWRDVGDTSLGLAIGIRTGRGRSR